MTRPIECHTLLSDQRTVALLDGLGDVVWFCPDRIDAPSVFGSLLGGPGGGYCRVRPADGRPVRAHAYVGDTMVARTEWDGLSVTDYLDIGAPVPTLVRAVEAAVHVEVRVNPAPGYGRPGVGPGRGTAGPAIEVRGPVGVLAPRAEPYVLEVAAPGGPAATDPAGDRAGEPARRAATSAYWSGWASRLHGPAWLRRSALLIAGLAQRSTGAITAAATTSLPEWIGGPRNWDYRYCWLRDASLAAAALARLGSLSEGVALLDWIAARVEATHGRPGDLRPLYAVDGSSLPPEEVLDHWPGYEESRPVRIGNAADAQVQLDVFGPVADLIATLHAHGAHLERSHKALLESLADAVRARWQEPDQGIWEIRSAPRHHVHSKAMCWLTVDRAMRVLGAGDRAPLRDAIAADIRAHGWSPGAASYTLAYGRSDVDAAVLHVVLSGLEDPASPRASATVERVLDELAAGAALYRYHAEDGVGGAEGGFLLCGFWAVDALRVLGRVDEAAHRFEALRALAGPTGLLAEEHDPASGRALGNVPQTYSHHGLIDSAVGLGLAT